MNKYVEAITREIHAQEPKTCNLYTCLGQGISLGIAPLKQMFSGVYTGKDQNGFIKLYK